VAEGCFQRGENWGLQGEVQIGYLRRQVMDFGCKVLKSSRDVDPRLKRGAE